MAKFLPLELLIWLTKITGNFSLIELDCSIGWLGSTRSGSGFSKIVKSHWLEISSQGAVGLELSG